MYTNEMMNHIDQYLRHIIELQIHGMLGKNKDKGKLTVHAICMRCCCARYCMCYPSLPHMRHSFATPPVRFDQYTVRERVQESAACAGERQVRTP